MRTQLLTKLKPFLLTLQMHGRSNSLTPSRTAPLYLAIELNGKSHIAERKTFTCEADVVYMFIQMTTDLDAKKEAGEILKTKPEGNTYF